MNIIITESQLSHLKESIDYKPGVKRDRLTKIVRKMSNRQEPLSRKATHDEFNDTMFFPSGPDQRKEKPKHLKDKELKQREDDKKISMGDMDESDDIVDMLQEAKARKDWGMVSRAISYMKHGL